MSDGYCDCGLAVEDPLHYGFHRIKTWNEGVRDDARRKAMEKFDKQIIEEDKRRQKEKKWKSLDI